MQEMQEQARKQWEQEQLAKARAAYSPLLPPPGALRRAIVAELRRRNAAMACPDPICPRCHLPTAEDQRDPLFRKLCATCGARHVDKLLCRIRRRLGRKAAVRALKRIARGG
jgi:hypothetical protein